MGAQPTKEPSIIVPQYERVGQGPHFEHTKLSVDNINASIEDITRALTITPQEVCLLHKRLCKTLSNGMGDLSKNNRYSEHHFLKPSWVADALPDGSEFGVSYAIDIGGIQGHLVRIQTHGRGEMSHIEKRISLRDPINCALARGLTDACVSKAKLFQCLAKALWDFYAEERGTEGLAPLAVTMPFELEQHSLTSATLVRWSGGIKTGRSSDDPVEDKDIAGAFAAALKRIRAPFKIRAVVTDTVRACACACVHVCMCACVHVCRHPSIHP
eukprot:GHVU01140902.1.p1 GENE.GHVU01140902.1~~GHVU01140902.1.p1  ORF type:complete len:271 (+),score=30.42 GHVU01140902.1:60-872(+)